MALQSVSITVTSGGTRLTTAPRGTKDDPYTVSVIPIGDTVYLGGGQADCLPAAGTPVQALGQAEIDLMQGEELWASGASVDVRLMDRT